MNRLVLATYCVQQCVSHYYSVPLLTSQRQYTMLFDFTYEDSYNQLYICKNGSQERQEMISRWSCKWPLWNVQWSFPLGYPWCHHPWFCLYTKGWGTKLSFKLCLQQIVHSLSYNCPTKGFPTLRHNKMRDNTVARMSKVCLYRTPSTASFRRDFQSCLH